MKGAIKKAACLLVGAGLLASAGCGGTEQGGNPNLSFGETNTELCLENENIRIIFNKTNGSIKELLNKKSNLYLVKGNDYAVPISIQVRGSGGGNQIFPKEDSFSYSVSANTGEKKALSFSWEFTNGVRATATAALRGSEDGIVFTSAIGGLDGKTISVQYPVVDNIGHLSEDVEKDRFLSPMATGYLFLNPVDNFFHYGRDVSGQSAAYPSGFGSTMQFMSYYAEDKGGFYVQTKDGGNTIKDFTMRNNSGTLRMEVGHYVDDLARASAEFSYETVISNLYEGNWYEPAERYRDWAEEQSWAKKNGKNVERTDLNRDVYENSVLVNFITPSKSDQPAALPLYEIIRDNIKTEGSKILTVPWYYSIPQEVSPTDDIEAYFNTNKNAEFYAALEENGEPVAHFEYTDMHRVSNMAVLPDYIRDSRIRTVTGDYSLITFAEDWNYICASNEQFVDLVTRRQKKQFSELKVQGIYNDLGICAVHPLQCYDTTHSHGSRINILENYYELMRQSFEISREATVDAAGNHGFTGQEMITEQAMPYVDFYQTRSAAGEMGGMENDMIMPLVKDDVAIKVPLFEYVYHEYAGVRADGFTLPVSSVGVPYYQTMAYTALNGGIPEFNYECYNHKGYDALVGDMNPEMISFIDTLGKARLTYGKEWLVYGRMARAPELGLAAEEFEYETPIVINWNNVGGVKSGTIKFSPVVVSAWEKDGKIAIFLCNVTEDDREVSFTLDADALYGISYGTIRSVCDGEQGAYSGTIEEGKADINLTLRSRSVYMLTIE